MTTRQDDDVATETRAHLAIALDVPELDSALRLARRVKPWFSVAKIGLELFVAEGPRTVEALLTEGFEVFLDLKLHDIPNTVGRAARSAGALGARLVTAHACGGEAMLRAAVEGFAEGAAGAGGPRAHFAQEAVFGRPAGILGVTVLTSDSTAAPDLLASRAALAETTGCAGIVCAAVDLSAVQKVLSRSLRVVPGIRLPDDSAGDQARVSTPGSALRGGADLLVVGRSVTSAADIETAAAAISADAASWREQ
ncbi:MAG: orotidine-5'-phosphate decarboxylase [Acidimicrobiales bacterium]